MFLELSLPCLKILLMKINFFIFWFNKIIYLFISEKFNYKEENLYLVGIHCTV